MSYVGATIGSYRIESRLGRGGMGEVYLGYDPRLERKVAVKTLRAEQRLSAVQKARFLREARLLGKLGHPAICQVYDLIETPEADFLILEHIEGSTLGQLSRREALSFDRKLELAEKIAAALAVAHREQIVHRDLKADNVMVTPEGEVKVLDFGIARSLSEPGGIRLVGPPDLPGVDDASLRFEEGSGETAAEYPTVVERPGPGSGGLWGASRGESTDDLTHVGLIVGSLQAMSPEQAAGGEITTASDLYSFGILLQELATGEPAYESQSKAGLLAKVQRAETRPLPATSGLDPDLVRLLRDLQSLDPRRRPTAEEAAEQLRALSAKPQRLRRRRLRRAAVTAAVVLLALGLALVSWFAVEANRARREAERRRRQAEGLIGFMMGDLRKRLERVNRLEILDAVGDRALSYFGELPEGDLTRPELARRVEAVIQIGEVRYAQGKLPAALLAFRRAAALAEELTARDPEHRAGVRELFTAQSWIGQVHYDQREADAALSAWSASEALVRRQLDRRRGDPEWLAALASAQHNVGTARELRGDLEGALRDYRQSLALQRSFAAQKPDDLETQAALAATLAFVSNSLERQGDLAGALAERRAHLAIQEKLAARDPGNPERRYDLAVARGFLANLLVVHGELEAARGQYAKGLPVFARLAAEDPDNALSQRWLASFEGALGNVALNAGDPRTARPYFERARAAFARLLAKDPDNRDFRLNLGITHSNLALVWKSAAPARARAEAETAARILAPLGEADLSEPTRGLLASVLVARGTLEEEQGNRVAAEAAWQRALDLLASCRQPVTYWKILSAQALAQLLLGRVEEARPAVLRLRAMGYVNRDLEKIARERGL